MIGSLRGALLDRSGDFAHRLDGGLALAARQPPAVRRDGQIDMIYESPLIEPNPFCQEDLERLPFEKHGVAASSENGKAELYVHHKVMTINGHWFGRSNTKVVYTGSQNYTNPGTRLNDELVLRIRDGATLNAYDRNLNLIRDRHAKRLTRVG